MDEGLHLEEISQPILAPWAAETSLGTVELDVFNKLSLDSRKA